MQKVTVRIDGMMCGMCEAHVADAIRAALPQAKKVKASRAHGEATFLIDGGFDAETLKKAVDETGYTFGGVTCEEYKKHGLFGR